MSQDRGVVFLVGAGPGDPGLITVRGLQVLRRADVVVHDRLVGQELLKEVRAGVEIINVGKMPGAQRLSQGWINALLVDRARRGMLVVRLKGGDPFVFGRGYEELTACRRAGIDCVVIPGVSSALAAPAAAGIPVTSRHLGRSLTIVTGSTATESEAPPLDYSALATVDTLVILMGRANLAEITQSLIEAGRSPGTPAACIEQATTPGQRVTVATLASIADAADRDDLRPPVVTVIGAVAAEAQVTEVAAFAVHAGG